MRVKRSHDPTVVLSVWIGHVLVGSAAWPIPPPLTAETKYPGKKSGAALLGCSRTAPLPGRFKILKCSHGPEVVASV
jgi:hypothetical protein